jgi:integrase
MATHKLDDRFARIALGPDQPGRAYVLYYDSQTRGFGLRVTRNLARSWILNFRVRGGRERRLTIGDAGDWPIKLARAEAQRLRRIIDIGGDPMRDRRAERAAPTIDELSERYKADYMPRKRPSSQAEDLTLIEQWVVPELGPRKVAEIRHSDIERLHRKVSGKTPIRANRLIALLSKMFSLAVKWELRPDNPCKGLQKNPEQSRERYLSAEEIRRLADVLSVFPNRAVANAVTLLLLTGARRNEVLSARWEHFDLEQGVWIKPAMSTKTGKPHRVPLSQAALAVLAAVPRDGIYLFPARSRSKHASGREQGVNGAGHPGHLTDLKHEWRKICELADLDGVRLHDLRHSFASLLVNGGASLPLIGELLGHRQVQTTARYSHLYDDTQRAAVETVGATIASKVPCA